ncbi:hypothetical protein PACILC2_21650 [Paenibacillus cisolokensis]|uniref:Uncharacterized protein n=1 Tax=Paenibacillus cisolokensis TaxID=1658519 RepID=A0ABQ4N621_9BACL|nr:hypothetical protein PACILC2_21650 [Paenibacillus cisolokensis]
MSRSQRLRSLINLKQLVDTARSERTRTVFARQYQAAEKRNAALADGASQATGNIKFSSIVAHI